MTDTTEQEALALVNEVAARFGITELYEAYPHELANAICRAIERDKAFRQEVCDVFEATISAIDRLVLGERDEAMVRGIRIATARFIIAKPDPLVEAMQEWWDADGYADIETFRAAIEKRGGKIIFNEEQN